MGFSRQEYWSGLPCPPPGDLPNPRVKPRSPALQADSLSDEPPGKPSFLHSVSEFICWHSSLFDRTHTSLQWDPITGGRQKAPRYSSQMLHRWLEALRSNIRDKTGLRREKWMPNLGAIPSPVLPYSSANRKWGQQQTQPALPHPPHPTPLYPWRQNAHRRVGCCHHFVSGTRHWGFWLLISTGAPGINLPGILRDDCTFTSPLYQVVVLIYSSCLSFLSHTANSRWLSILHMLM